VPVILNELLTLIGGVTAIVAASTACAYLIFRTFTTKWIDTRFAERLEAFRHQQSQEIERLRFHINTMMDRNVKLHEREFELLPQTWASLAEAFSVIEPVALEFQQYPDLNNMSMERLEDFIANSRLTDLEKSELIAAPDKNRFYSRIKAGSDLGQAVDAYNEYHKVLTKNGIFIIESLKQKFLQLDGMLKDAIIERQISREFSKAASLHGNGRALLRSLEQEVQQRLWSSQQE
jgi:hypothetical protein